MINRVNKYYISRKNQKPIEYFVSEFPTLVVAIDGVVKFRCAFLSTATRYIRECFVSELNKTATIHDCYNKTGERKFTCNPIPLKTHHNLKSNDNENNSTLYRDYSN